MNTLSGGHQDRHGGVDVVGGLPRHVPQDLAVRPGVTETRDVSGEEQHLAHALDGPPAGEWNSPVCRSAPSRRVALPVFLSRASSDLPSGLPPASTSSNSPSTSGEVEMPQLRHPGASNSAFRSLPPDLRAGRRLLTAMRMPRCPRGRTPSVTIQGRRGAWSVSLKRSLRVSNQCARATAPCRSRRVEAATTNSPLGAC